MNKLNKKETSEQQRVKEEPSLHVALAIIKVRGRLLFQVREEEPYLQHIGLVGGKLEEGESPEKAIKREILEESGLQITNVLSVGEVIEVLNDGESEKNVRLLIFTAECSKQYPTSSEEGSIILLDEAELEALREKFIPTDWLIVAKVLKGTLSKHMVRVRQRDNKYQIIESNLE